MKFNFWWFHSCPKITTDNYSTVPCALEAEIANAGMHMVWDATVRQAYAREIREMSLAVRKQVDANKITWAEAAKEANKLRNDILEILCTRSTPVGRAKAQAMKRAMLQQTDAITLGNKIPEQTDDIATAISQIGESDNVSPSCELMIHGKGTGQRLDGYYLETALQYDAGYLVFMNHDCPYEETLSIYLVDHAGVLQDSAHIGGMYTTGIFRNLQTQQPDQVSFEFFAEATYTVKLLHSPGFRMPFFSEPIGVCRPFGFKRRFVVTETRHVKHVYPIVVLFRNILNVLRFRKQNDKSSNP